MAYELIPEKKYDTFAAKDEKNRPLILLWWIVIYFIVRTEHFHNSVIVIATSASGLVASIEENTSL